MEHEAQKPFNGYKEAAVIDKKINKLLETFPITELNAAEWAKFARMFLTSNEIIAEECMKYSHMTKREG